MERNSLLLTLIPPILKTEDPRLMDLTLNNFDQRFNGKVDNNGHTVLFFPDTGSS